MYVMKIQIGDRLLLMKKILIISPKYSGNDGLSHHTKKLFEKLGESSFIDCSLLTSFGQCKNSKVLAQIKNWGMMGLISQFEAIERAAPDEVLIQYVPYMYGRRGLSFALPLLVLLMKIKGIKVNTYFHELHYPYENTFKSFILFFIHHIQFLLLAVFSNRCFFTTSFFKDYTSRMLCGMKKSLYCLPVSSNINLKSEQIDFSQNEVVVSLFGSLHPSRRTHQLLELLAKNKNIKKIIYVGLTLDEIAAQKQLSLSSEELNKIDARGFLSDEELSNIYLSDVVAQISYFTDGVSTRRGSVMTAIQHGTPVVSTKSKRTDKILENIPGVYLFSTDIVEFEKKITDLFSQDDILSKLKSHKACLRSFYKAQLDWNVVVGNLIKVIINN